MICSEFNVQRERSRGSLQDLSKSQALRAFRSDSRLKVKAANTIQEKYIVNTGYAKYLGNFAAPYSVGYLGLPYAEPPLGERRFRKPVRLNTSRIIEESKGDVIDARTYPDFCVQGSTGNGDAGGAGAEDCLKVNVYAPMNATRESKLPVLCYIHGGAYIYSNPRNFPSEHWINQSPDVVIVSVYYRLDSFGFLAHSGFSGTSSTSRDTQSGSDYDTLADFNVGLHDQRLALEWIQNYISAFGGDPAKVTINGQSAGAASIILHLVANEGKQNLFRGAIIQSAYRGVLPLPYEQDSLFDFFAEEAGCGGATALEGTISCLRKASVSTLAMAQDAGGSFWRPVVDGSFIPDYPSRMVSQGRFSYVPLIAGATSNETLVPFTDYIQALHANYPRLSAAELGVFDVVYHRSQFSSDSEWMRTAMGEPLLRCARELLGAAGNAYSSTWAYRYNQPNPTQHKSGITEHAAENWMMFLGVNTGVNGTAVFTGLNPIETLFASELIAYWLSFVRALDPNKFKLTRSPEWPEYSEGSRLVLQENDDASDTASGTYIEPEPIGDLDRCAFVISKAEHMQN